MLRVLKPTKIWIKTDFYFSGLEIYTDLFFWSLMVT